MTEARRPVHGGLKLDAPAGVSMDEYTNVIQKWKDAEDWAKQQVVELLGPLDKRPPPLSGNELMTVSPNEYSAIYTFRLGWFNEVGRHLTAVKVTFKRYELTEADLARKIRHVNRSLSTQKVSVEEMKDRVGMQPHREQIELEMSKWEWLKLLLEQEHKEAEENLKAISRQVEVRKEEFGGERRDGNIPANMRKYTR